MASSKNRTAVTTYLHPEEAEELTQIARRRDVPVAQILREQLRRYLQAVREGARP